MQLNGHRGKAGLALGCVRWAGALVLVFWALAAAHAGAETRARCGQGFLEMVDDYPVVHLKGTPYEMGYQHGTLLKDHIRQNMHYILEVKGQEKLKVLGLELMTARDAIRTVVARQRKFVPHEFTEELDGLADGAGVAREDVQLANFIPEMFHCSGFALMDKATKDGTLYHGRVLDYAIDWHLQEHAVLIVAEPDGGIPFVNVSYAGFIGSVTGMNAAGVSIGEMGGKGLGHWDGVPMACLVRQVLQQAKTLDDAVAVFRDQPRTCQYYYVIADGKTNRAVGMEASWDTFTLMKPGEGNPQLPHAVPDAVLLSAGTRYEELTRRVQADWGKFDEVSARKLMDCPVAMKSNLHDVLFAPRSTKLWVANASPDKQPAATQPYHAFQLTELLKHQPQSDVPETPCPKQPAGKAAAAPIKDDAGWKSLLDGKSLTGWKSVDFGDEGKVSVQDGAVVMEKGRPMTGIVYTRGDFPKIDYEVTLEARKIAGEDFFCTTTFPVGDSFCSFVVGGWGGTVVGLSSIDGADASENETTRTQEFKQDQWYRVRIRVTKQKIEAWIDRDKMVDLDTTDRKISIRIECRPCRPFGIATYDTTGAVRDVRVRMLAQTDK